MSRLKKAVKKSYSQQLAETCIGPRPYRDRSKEPSRPRDREPDKSNAHAAAAKAPRDEPRSPHTAMPPSQSHTDGWARGRHLSKQNTWRAIRTVQRRPWPQLLRNSLRLKIASSSISKKKKPQHHHQAPPRCVPPRSATRHARLQRSRRIGGTAIQR